MSISVAENGCVGHEKVLTPEEVLRLARKITGDQSVRVLDYHLDDYSKEFIGLTGSHYSLKVTFQKSQTDSPVSVHTFVKGLPKRDVNGAYKPILMQESFFFEKIVPELTHNYKSERWCPVYYMTTKNVIIIEDLKFSGYRLLENFYDNLAVLKSVLASLARFHSCSILAEARLSRQSKKPVTLSEYFKGSIIEMMFVAEGDGAKYYNSSVNLACALAERLGYNPVKIREIFSRVYDMVKPSETHRNVICHGDLHIKNLMFADNSPPILIDFQILRYAPLVTDILQYLHLNASRKFREQNQRELIECYHSVLVETIKTNDPTIEPPSLASILKSLEDFRAYGLIVACTYIPMALLGSKEHKTLVENPESLINFKFGDRLEVVSAHMERDESFKQIVESAIVELAEKSNVIKCH